EICPRGPLVHAVQSGGCNPRRPPFLHIPRVIHAARPAQRGPQVCLNPPRTRESRRRHPEAAFCRSEVAFCEAEQDHRDTPFTVRRVPSVGAPCRAGGGLTRMVLFVALMTPEGGAERDRERRQRRLRSGETVLANSTA